MVSFGGNPISAALATAMTRITGKSGGDAHQAMLQALGMDQRSAALQGALHDYGQGNLAGYQKNMVEAFTGVDPGRIGAGMAQSHHIGSPSACLGQRYERMDLKKSTKAGLGAMLGGFALGGPLGALIGRSLSKRSKAKTLERRLNRDPIFRAQFEASVGGRYVPDFRNDGKITIARNNFGLPGMNPGIMAGLGGNPIAGSALSGLARMMGNAAGMMQSFGASGGGFGAFSGQGVGGFQAYNSPYGSKSSFGADAKPGSFMSKLPPNATFEDLVSAFMMDTVKEMQEEIKKEMDKMKASNEAKGGENGRRGYGGALGSLGGIAGGVLGGMVGGPMGSQLGSSLGGAAGNALGGGGQGQGGTDKSDSRQLMFENLKNMMNKLQQMMQSMSNVLNTMHQGAMNSIRNIRA